ncbi:lamin tail domain-containing protein, partial [bacterium]|nr:lamin tail domain-containing protein [bacterium]
MSAIQILFLAGAAGTVSGLAQTAPVAPRMPLAVNEMMIDPPAGMCEWMELFNTGSEPVSLEAWRISDRDTANYVRLKAPCGPVPPQGYAV